MLKNYFLTAFRNFRHNKIFLLINILGLSIGLSSALVIYLIVEHDLTYDHFEPGRDRIYRVVTDMQMAGTLFPIGGIPTALPPALRSEVPGLERVSNFETLSDETLCSIPSNAPGTPREFKGQANFILADGDYFGIVPYDWLAGSPRTALTGIYQVVLTESRAKTYFPDASFAQMMGRQIILYHTNRGDTLALTVTGIVRDLEKNSDFQFKGFVSLATVLGNVHLQTNYSSPDWGGVSSSTQLFVKLAPGVKAAGLESRLKTLLQEHNPKANKDSKNSMVFRLQPLSELHFNATYGTIGEHLASKSSLSGLLVVAAFLLLLGCINFINLSTAQAAGRAKEIGIRKTMGGSRRQLMGQFLTETFLVTCFASLISLGLTPVLLQVFSDFIPKDLHFSLANLQGLPVFLPGLILVVTVLSGFYPALFLSRFNPVLVLKNQAFAGSGASRKAILRRGLTVAQFFVAQVFIMGTLFTVKQIHFLLNKDMGFAKEGIVLVSLPYNRVNWQEPDARPSVMLNELHAIPGIRAASLAGELPAASGWSSRTLTFRDGKKEIESDVRVKSGDSNYLAVYRIRLLAGRNIRPSDSSKAYLINETYMHLLGFQNPEQIVNKQVDSTPVVGVVADFNLGSLHETIKPLVFSADSRGAHRLNIALKPSDAEGKLWTATIDRIRAAFGRVYPGEVFSYHFFDETIAKFYDSEQHISRLLKWATGLAVGISCLGLLGLVIYSTNLRAKEISVRKVLGASVLRILGLLSRDFLVLVGIAFVVASPLAWWAMNRWLNSFAYRTSLSWWVFVLSGLCMALIALVTLSIQTIRAAAANPVKSLRSE